MHYEKDSKVLLDDPIEDGVLHFGESPQTPTLRRKVAAK
jgi:hypothetical protein